MFFKKETVKEKNYQPSSINGIIKKSKSFSMRISGPYKKEIRFVEMIDQIIDSRRR